MLLKKYFPMFYNQHKKYLIFACFGLTFPLLLRGGYDGARYFSESFDEWVYKHTNTWNVVIILFCDAIPSIFQLQVLVFGYIRTKQQQQSRESIPLTQDPNTITSSESFYAQSRFASYFFEPPLREGSYS